MLNAEGDYDFMVSRSVLAETLEAYRKVERQLQLVKEDQMESLSSITQNWHGNAADALIAGTTYFFEEGNYNLACELITRMRCCLEEYLPRINDLLAICESFEEQLRFNDYVEPPRGGFYVGGDILAIRYEDAARVKMLCDEVVEENKVLTAKMAETIESCRDLISDTDFILEELYDASRKVNRAANYREALERYEAGIRALEADMAVDFAAIAAIGRPQTVMPFTRKEVGGSVSAVSHGRCINGFLEKPLFQWTQEEQEAACFGLEIYMVDKAGPLLRDVARALLNEKYETKTVRGCSGLYYKAELDKEKIAALLNSSTAMHLSRAVRFLHLLEGVHTESLPVKLEGTGSVDFDIQQKVENTVQLITRVATDSTVAVCQTEAGEITRIEDLPPGNQEEMTEFERYLELGLTGYVKYGYHELIAAKPDGMVLIYGLTNAKVFWGSVLQSLVNDGNFSKFPQYLITNERSREDGCVEGLWDNTLGELESITQLLIQIYDLRTGQPANYIQNVLTGSNMDGSLERGTKVSLSVLQLLTGIPFYTITSDFEKTYEELKEGIDAFIQWMDKTPEEWQTIVDNALKRVSSQVEDMQALTEEVATLTPEEWAVIFQDTLDAMGQYAEAEVQYLFSEEGMSEVSYSVGNAEGTVAGMLFMEFFEYALGLKFAELVKGKRIKWLKGGSSTLNDWVNRIPELSKQAPIEIPSSATVKVQAKNGYDQISFKWTENGQNYEVRWHTKTPGAPEGQGNTWVISRVTPGTPTGQVRTEHILAGDTWIPRYQWQDAINAYRNGTATQEQLQLLKDGHWQAP